jgi:hypothetical protein
VHRSEIFPTRSAPGQTPTTNIRVLCLLPPAADIMLKSAKAAVCQEPTLQHRTNLIRLGSLAALLRLEA